MTIEDTAMTSTPSSRRRGARAVLTFGLPPTAPRRLEAIPFRAALARAAGVDLRVLAFPTYAALFQAVDSRACDVAWTPPLIALDLVRCGSASPMLALVRARGADYYAGLVTRAAARFRGARDLEGASVGWVAPESASGYVVPRLHLRSIGVDPDTFFSRETFFGSHVAATHALLAGEVDAIATYAEYDAPSRSFVAPGAGERGRVVAAAGPIPGDVIVARSDLGTDKRDRVAGALRGLSDRERASLIPLMNAERFADVDDRHLDALRSMSARAAESALAPLRPFLRG